MRCRRQKKNQLDELKEHAQARAHQLLEHLVRARSARQWGQEQLAQALGWDQGSVARRESGVHWVSHVLFLQWCEALEPRAMMVEEEGGSFYLLPDPKDLAVFLRQRRCDKGLSLAAVGRQLGISAQSLSRLESGSAHIRGQNLVMLINWLGRLQLNLELWYESASAPES